MKILTWTTNNETKTKINSIIKNTIKLHNVGN